MNGKKRGGNGNADCRGHHCQKKDPRRAEAQLLPPWVDEMLNYTLSAYPCKQIYRLGFEALE